MSECCLFLRGELFIADALPECSNESDGLTGCGETSLNYRKVGNTSSIQVQINSLIIGRENKFNKVDPSSRVSVSGVNLSLVVNCANKLNLLQSLYAVTNTLEDDTKTEHFCVCSEIKEDKFLLLKYTPIRESAIVTLRDPLGNELMILEEGEDFLLSGNKIEIIKDNGSDGDVIAIEYLVDNSKIYEAKFFSAIPSYKDVRFIGKNYATDSDETYDIRFFRVLFQPIASLEFISNGDFFNLPLESVVEESRNGYFKMTKNGEDYEPVSPIY